MGIDHTGVHNALADGGRHTQVKNKYGNEIEHRGKQHRLAGFQHAGGHHGGNRVGRVVEAVHEIKCECQQHQQHHHPQGHLRGFRHVVPQEFSRTMPSMRLAASSHLSVIISSN